MSMPRSGISKIRPLEILGISEAEERVYRWLLVHPDATSAEVSKALSLTSRNARRLLETIEAKGLATHSPQRLRRYVAIPPDMAMDELVIQRQKDLQRAQEAIRELQEHAVAKPKSERERMIELITSGEAQRRIYGRMQRTAQDEVVALIRPPMLISRLERAVEQDQAIQREAQARGVRYRGIVDTEFLALPGAVARVRSDARAGEEVRVLSRLPFKMMLADRCVAFIPLSQEQLDGPLLLVRSSPLLDALYVLFETLWEQAAPLSFTPAGALEVENPDAWAPPDMEELMLLLATGVNDKKILDQLGISQSTLSRRVAWIMKALNARTRYQAGWQAARRQFSEIPERQAILCNPPGKSGMPKEAASASDENLS